MGYKTVRSLQRGMEVLCALNRNNGASVQALAQSIGVHRTTVQRLLETLRAMGYVSKSASDDQYRLAPGVRRLSDGFDDDAWVSAIAEPALRALHPRLLWPTNVATLDGDAMLIRESTHRYSPLSIHHATVGQRLPMLRSALGRCTWVCPTRSGARSSPCSGAAPMRRSPATRRSSRRVLRRARRGGYVAKLGDREKRIVAVAVPILRGERVFACINTVFFRRAMSIPVAVRRCLEPLRETAAAISARLEEESLWPGHGAAVHHGGEPERPARLRARTGVPAPASRPTSSASPRRGGAAVADAPGCPYWPPGKPPPGRAPRPASASAR